MPTLVRRQDTTRKDARERKKERRAEELLLKKEEVKRMKALEMKKHAEQLRRIASEGGRDVDDEGQFPRIYPASIFP